LAKRTGERLGQCGLCRRALIRPVQTVRAQDRLYHLTCWRETTPTGPTRPRPLAIRETMAQLDPLEPLTRDQTLAVLLTLPMTPWVRRRLEQAQKST
jgi:hypothetical protein